MSHVGKRPRENRARRAEGVEGAEEEGLSASFATAAACVWPLNLLGFGRGGREGGRERK